MHELKAFNKIIPSVKLTGNITLINQEIALKFILKDEGRSLQNSFDIFKPQDNYPRDNELWKDTCFEAFWSVPGSLNYWEFNFSCHGSWNLYFFDEYRKPFPPKESFDFELSRVFLKGDNLELKLKAEKPILNIEASICAVLKTKSNETYYYSTYHGGNNHSGTKPDFHLRDSFTIATGKNHKIKPGEI